MSGICSYCTLVPSNLILQSSLCHLFLIQIFIVIEYCVIEVTVLVPIC